MHPVHIMRQVQLEVYKWFHAKFMWMTTVTPMFANMLYKLSLSTSSMPYLLLALYQFAMKAKLISE